MMLTQLNHLPEPQRLIMRNAIQRINDISNDLLMKSTQVQNRNFNTTKSISVNESTQIHIQLMSPVVDALVSEKRIQFREKQNIEIAGDVQQGYGLFANINGSELKRALSNLLNNSIESFPEAKGRVLVSIHGNRNQVYITVQDNGKGIPQNILKKLGEIGVTYGKEGTQSGSGLGIYHAKKTVESSGGKLEISSIENIGTTISMHFPRSQAPKWFVEKLSLKPQQQVISLDDDMSIHSIWKGRFESQRLQEIGFQHLTFTSGQEFKDWFKSNRDFNLVRLYLVDYELLNQKQSGLEIINELRIGSQSILVTSRYEEESIREKCNLLGVRLIPKTMAAFVPIEVKQPKERYDACLIDDDDLIISTWKISAKVKNKTFISFPTPEAFFSKAANLDFATPIYVDSNLGNGVKGEEVSFKIYEIGFKNIWLCTGYDPGNFLPVPHLQGIIGKDPIF